MCGPMRGAIVGAALFEGWADSPEAAIAMIEQGEIAFEPCHHHGAVGPPARPVRTEGDGERQVLRLGVVLLLGHLGRLPELLLQRRRLQLRRVRAAREVRVLSVRAAGVTRRVG